MIPITNVTKGITQYADQEILPKMQNGLQKTALGVGISVIAKRGEALANSLMGNDALKVMGVTDGNGNVDIDLLREAVYENVPESGLPINIPFIGTMTFYPRDVDSLYAIIGGM